MRTVALLSLVLAPALAEAAPKTTAAGKPAGPACGAKILPLAVGNTWTYTQMPYSAPPDKDRERITPMQPKQVVVAVTGVEAQGADTVVTLAETVTYEVADPKKPESKIPLERKFTSKVTCNAKTFAISPESFFFAGEPGAFEGMTLDKVERKKDSAGWKLEKGGIGEGEWIDELLLHWTQVPVKPSEAKLSTGKLEMERKFTPQPVETITTKKGTYKAEKLGLITSGRVSISNAKAPDGKPCTVRKIENPTEKDPAKQKMINEPVEVCDLPANWIAQLWLADNVGMVQVLNAYNHMYQLVDFTLTNAPAK